MLGFISFQAFAAIASTHPDSTFSQVIINDPIEDSIKLTMYLDTMDKYMYMDAKIVDHVIKEFESILEKSDQETNAHLLKFASNKIYYAINNGDLIESYRIIRENEYLLNEDKIPTKIKINFAYLKGFTNMELGDHQVAQKVFVDLIEVGESNRDTSALTNGLYSLGQLFSEEKDYKSALIQLEKLSEILKDHNGRASTKMLLNYERSESYKLLGQYQKALEIIDQSLEETKKLKLDRLRPDFLILKGYISVDTGNTEEAEKIYEELAPIVNKGEDSYNKVHLKTLKAKILNANGEGKMALIIYDELLNSLDSNQLEEQYTTLEEAHLIASKMADHKLAYQYSTRQIQVKEDILKFKKKQETARLKVKFDSDKKEEENQQLALNISQERSQKKFLYLLSTFFLIGLLSLLYAFHQKLKFNESLKKEVNKQTEKLEVSNSQLDQSNQELFQFSHICSHDLKEPMLTIKSFLSLIEHENVPEKKSEYINYVNREFTRLSNLLEQIRIFFEICDAKKLDLGRVNLNEVFSLVKQDLKPCINKACAHVIFMNELDQDFINFSKFGLTLLLRNFVQNAIRFNQSEKPTVEVRFLKENGTLAIEITDNGIGIAEKYFEYIFEPFKTLKSRSEFNSAGLGLSISKKIIDALGGKIKMESDPQNGTKFHLLFHGKTNMGEELNILGSNYELEPSAR